MKDDKTSPTVPDTEEERCPWIYCKATSYKTFNRCDICGGEWELEKKETGGRNALNLQMALEGAEAFIGVMFGDENGDVPSTVVTPLGIPVKIGDIMREIREALQAARAASDKEHGK